VAVTFKGIGEKLIGVAIRLVDPVQDLETDRPGSTLSQNVPVLAISSSLAIRSSMGGCVLNREKMPPPRNGDTMNIWAVEGLACMGILWAAVSSFRGPLRGTEDG